MSYIQSITPFLTGSTSAGASININFSSFYNQYTALQIRLYGLFPATTNTDLLLRVSTDGTTFDSGASAYQYAWSYANSTIASGTSNTLTSTGATSIQLGTAGGNYTNGQTNGVIEIMNTSSASFFPTVLWDLAYAGNGSGIARIQGAGSRLAAQVTKGIQLLSSSGNITGSWAIYGFK